MLRGLEAPLAKSSWFTLFGGILYENGAPYGVLDGNGGALINPPTFPPLGTLDGS